MPEWARFIAALVGLALLLTGLFGVLVVRPFVLELVACMVFACGIGIDLLHGAITGRLPVSVLLWLG